MKLTLNIPESLKEINLNQYQQWLKIAEGEEMTDFIKQKMIEIFCGVNLKQVLQIKATDIESIVNDLNNLFKQDVKLTDRFKLDGLEFGFIPKLDDMSFGEYVDLDTYLADWQQMDKAMSVLFRPVTFTKKNKYLIEEYESATKYDLKEMTLRYCFWFIGFFLQFKERITETYPELFGESNGNNPTTRNESFSNKWGWYSPSLPFQMETS